MAYLKKIFNQTPQSAPIPGTAQVPNSAGGYAWQASQWDRLKRFLILGSEGGSYYASETNLTIENANHVLTCISEDGLHVIRETVAISDGGRAPKNDPAIFVLALCAGFGDEAVRKAALDALPRVCRTGTHLFQFVEYVQTFRGWGRGLRRGVGNWYTALKPRDLAYQVVKYRQRNGWSHTDLLRLAHPSPTDETRGAIYQWITKRDQAAWATADEQPTDSALAFIWAFERAQQAQHFKHIVRLIEDFDLPREALPTEWLKDARVWEALLEKMPLTAMIRNLGVMAQNGLLMPFSQAESTIVKRLRNADLLKRARIHPIAVLSALRVYAGGKGVRGSGSWTPTQKTIDALDDAFYLAFGTVEPSNKRTMLALDVSGSMGMGNISGVPGLTPRDATAALALVTARTEPNYLITGFSTQMIRLNISAKMRLNDAIRTVSGLPFAGTDCALPMLYALENQLKVDQFVVMTDSETWFGKVHPVQALQHYRRETGIPAQLVVVGMVANRFTIADPNDRGMLDVVGMDTATPQLISDFARGTI
ncbi:MAG: TROVE domain-containing protein [Chloroflexi bacterium]|nr:TROVE domain-containing protein [Chloroflexota bacterium]